MPVTKARGDLYHEVIVTIFYWCGADLVTEAGCSSSSVWWRMVLRRWEALSPWDQCFIVALSWQSIQIEGQWRVGSGNLSTKLDSHAAFMESLSSIWNTVAAISICGSWRCSFSESSVFSYSRAAYDRYNDCEPRSNVSIAAKPYSYVRESLDKGVPVTEARGNIFLGEVIVTIFFWSGVDMA